MGEYYEIYAKDGSIAASFEREVERDAFLTVLKAMYPERVFSKEKFPVDEAGEPIIEEPTDDFPADEPVEDADPDTACDPVLEPVAEEPPSTAVPGAESVSNAEPPPSV